jgi:hypothetical protein
MMPENGITRIDPDGPFQRHGGSRQVTGIGLLFGMVQQGDDGGRLLT